MKITHHKAGKHVTCDAIQEVFHAYLNKIENAITHLFLVILGNK